MAFLPPQPPRSSFPHYHFAILLAVAVSSIFFTIWATAGTLTPSGAPGSTMKTLQEIYDSVAGTTFDSSSVTADQNGSVIEGLKYISANMATGKSVSSDSIDFDEIMDTMTLDANTHIASAGFVFTVGGKMAVATSSTDFGLFTAVNEGGTNDRMFVLGDAFGDVSVYRKRSSWPCCNIFVGGLSAYGSLNSQAFSTSNPAAYISFLTDSSWGGTGAVPTAIRFLTAPNGYSALVERMRITSGGNIGINVGLNAANNANAVDAQFEIRGSVSFTIANVASISGMSLTTGNALAIRVPTSASFSGNVLQALDTDGRTVASISAAGNLEIAGYASLSQTLFIQRKGNVGIGITTPDAKLDVAGNLLASASGNVDFVLRSSTTNGVSNNDDAKFTLRVGSTSERFDVINGNGIKLVTVASTGHVGIGTSSPTALSTAGTFTNLNIQHPTSTGHGKLTLSSPGTSNGLRVGSIVFGPSGSSASDKRSAYITSDLSADSSTTVTGDLLFFTNNGGSVTERMRILANGNVGIGSAAPTSKLNISGGNCSDDAGGGGCTADYAEYYPASEDMEKGDLVMADTSSSSYGVRKSRGNAALLGVVSSAPAAIADGGSLQLMNNQYALEPRKPAVALVGRVPLKVSLENGPVQTGDRLTASSVPGVAMKATQPGMTVGVALEPLASIGSGSFQKVLTFVNVGYWAPEGYTPPGNAVQSGISSWFDDLIHRLSSNFDVIIGNGLIKTVQGIFDRVEVKEGVTIQDQVTGLPHCLTVVNGSMVTKPGSCGSTP